MALAGGIDGDAYGEIAALRFSSLAQPQGKFRVSRAMLQKFAKLDPPPRYALLALACAFVAFAIYWPALPGLFVSDDVHYLVTNEYIQRLNLANLTAILDPYGAPGKMTQNYAPVHLLLHGTEYALFGAWIPGYHAVNILLHAANSGLLALLFFRSGMPAWGALAGGGIFLVHPANVEAVAWVSQLKTTAGLCFALVALLLVRIRPGWSSLFFVLALLTKALTAFVWPVAILFEWTSGRAGAGNHAASAPPRARNLALACWAVVLVVYAVIEFPIFRYTNANVSALAPDLPGMLRGIIAIAGKYLVMAASGFGVATFQEAPTADSWLAPYFLVALPLLVALGCRLALTAARREVEAVYWSWALISFAPVCQVFPFLHPVADRYLYFILPGLLGGVLLFAAKLRSLDWRNPVVRKGAATVCIVVLVFFALRAHERAGFWGDPQQLDADAIRNFPNGLVAHLENASIAAGQGDAEAVAAHLNFALERGVFNFYSYQGDPVWSPVRGDPRFQAVIEEMARRWLLLEPLYVHPSQIELRGLAHARVTLGDDAEAQILLERALEVGGLRDDQVRRELVSVKLAIQKQQAAAASADPDPQ